MRPFPTDSAELFPARNLAAGIAVCAVVLQLALAQVTLGLASVFLVIAALTRWRPAWLIWPAMAGLGWIAVIGAARAGAGYAAAAWHLLGVVAAARTPAGQLGLLGPFAAGWQRWLPAQLPVAFVAAAAEAAVVGRLAARGPYRPGLLVAARRGYVRASLRRGEVATSDGGCVGVIADTGRRASVSWREAAGGVLVTGMDAGAVASTCLDLVAAAIGHRKSAVVIDLTSGAITGGERCRPGAATVPASVMSAVTATCATAGAPLAVFGQGRERYTPFSEADPGAAADLVIAMTGVAENVDGRRAFCAEYARAVFEVIARGPARAVTRAVTSAGHQQPGLVDELAMLMRPGALEARLNQAGGPCADGALRRRVSAVTRRAEPGMLAPLATRLASLRRSPAGELLSQPLEAGAPVISLARALAERQVAVFPLDQRALGAAGVLVARLVVADLIRVLGERAGASADGLAWINGCEAMDAASVAALVEAGRAAGVATMLSTTDGSAAAALAARLNVVVLRGRPPRGLTSQAEPAGGSEGERRSAAPRPARRTGWAGETLLCQEDRDVLPAVMLAACRADALSVRVSAPVPRIVTGAQVVR